MIGAELVAKSPADSHTLLSPAQFATVMAVDSNRFKAINRGRAFWVISALAP